MLLTIDAAHTLGSVRSVIFTGGECFMAFDDLVAAVGHAHRLGLRTRCVSNGFWAKSPARGRHYVDRIVEAGLDELNLSTGDAHQRFVPVQAVENAACIAAAAGIVTRIVVEESAERDFTAEDLRRRPRIAALLDEPPPAQGEQIFDVLESPWMPMDADRSIASGRTLTKSKLPSCDGCRSIFTTIVRSPDDQLGICCGLSRSLIPELNTPFDAGGLVDTLRAAGEDFMKIWLYVDGPEKILAWAASHDPTISWEGRYAHHCHVCLAIFKDERVRRVILANYAERVDDVLMRYRVRQAAATQQLECESLLTVA